jgi:hypothetical protein
MSEIWPHLFCLEKVLRGDHLAELRVAVYVHASGLSFQLGDECSDEVFARRRACRGHGEV